MKLLLPIRRRRQVFVTLGVLALFGLLVHPAVRAHALNVFLWGFERAFPAHLVAMHRTLDPLYPGGAVLFVGDSLVAQLPVRRASPRAINLGVGGIGTRHAHANLTGLVSLRRAQALVLLVGTNDLFQQPDPPADLAGEMTRLLAALPPALELILCSVAPIDPEVHRDRSPAAIRRLNEIWRQCAAGRPKTTWLDLHPGLADGSGVLRREFHQGDGLHFSRDGNRKLADMIRSALEASPQAHQERG